MMRCHRLLLHQSKTWSLGSLQRCISRSSSRSSSSIKVLWNERVVFPDRVCAGSVTIDTRSGKILDCGPHESQHEARQHAKDQGWTFVSLSSWLPNDSDLNNNNSTVLAPGLVDVHTHISALGRTWEGYETATKAAVAGGITTLMGMPLNSLPPTTTVDAVALEQEAALASRLWCDVGLWGGVVPDNCPNTTTESQQQQQLHDLLESPLVFGLKAFLAPLPEAAGYAAVTPHQLKCAASVCRSKPVGRRRRPILVHCELMTQEQVDQATQHAFASLLSSSDPTTTASNEDDNNSTIRSSRNPWYEAHIQSRPPEWERRAVEVVCDIVNSDTCSMHIVHLSDAGCLPLIAQCKQQQQQSRRQKNHRLTVETCPHYLLWDSSTIAEKASAANGGEVDTRYKCFPPIRNADNRRALWTHGMETGLIDMLASDHSPCKPDMRDTDLPHAWGGLAGLQYQLPASWQALTDLTNSEASSSLVSKDDEARLLDMTRWWSTHPCQLVPGLSSRKGAIQVGYQADFVWWHPNVTAMPNEYSKEHHRWKGGTVYAQKQLRGRVLGTWLRGQHIYDGLSDTHISHDDNNNEHSLGQLMQVTES